jgi:hypothetical protein
MSEEEDSLVKYNDLPTPPLIQKAFERMSPPSARGKEGVEGREVYVNSQWALGGEGTGAPVSHSMHGNDLMHQFRYSVCSTILSLYHHNVNYTYPPWSVAAFLFPSTLLYSEVLYSTALTFTLLYRTLLYCTVLYSTVL